MGVLPIGRLLTNMAVPMMISMLVQACYNVVDSVFVAQISEDALKIVIGNEVGEKHKEEEKKFDGHKDSPALPAAALFADLFCLIGQSAVMHAADTVKIVGVDLNFFILEDMLPPDTFGIGTINVMFPCKH